jgi:hypothetical protein
MYGIDRQAFKNSTFPPIFKFFAALGTKVNQVTQVTLRAVQPLKAFFAVKRAGFLKKFCNIGGNLEFSKACRLIPLTPSATLVIL